MFTALLLSAPFLLTEPTQEPLTISQLVEMALAHNHESKISWWQAQKATEAVKVAKSSFFPTIDLNMAATHGKEYEFTNGPNKKFTQTTAELVLSMMLLDFGERSHELTARRKALQAAKWDADFAVQKVMIDTIELAYNVLHAQETAHAARITQDDAQRMLKASESLQKAGFTPITDVYTAKVTLADMQMNLAEWQAELDIRKAKLAQQIGYTVDTPFELAALKAIAPPKKSDIKTLLNKAKAHRKDLLAQAARLQEAEAELQKGYSSYMPKLSLDGSGGLNHFHHDNTKTGTYSIGLNLKIPLFSGFDSIYKNRMAFADRETSLQQLAKLEIDIANEVLKAFKEHEAAETMLKIANESLQNARLAYDAALEKYKAGKEGMFQDTSNAL
ncbi:MAG: TolC family protein, partial [Verrucomicrobia bacterium]|nr:TolC family protein [Verrucomicrobiota bacterium]